MMPSRGLTVSKTPVKVALLAVPTVAAGTYLATVAPRRFKIAVPATVACALKGAEVAMTSGTDAGSAMAMVVVAARARTMVEKYCILVCGGGGGGGGGERSLFGWRSTTWAGIGVDGRLSLRPGSSANGVWRVG